MDFIPQMTPWFDQKEADACYNYMTSGAYLTEYKYTTKLEQMICDFTNSKHCVMVNNGTISLSIALLAIGIQPNDEVILPNLTMIATPNAVKLLGAKPILVDIEENTLNIDLTTVESYINERTKAIIHVSLNGRCNDLYKLVELCQYHNIKLIEDSAQSLGSFYQNKHLGTYGDIGSFSFSSPKIISTGQGGALITNNDHLASKIKKIKNFGRETAGDDIYLDFGINSKFTDIQAVIGLEQMKKLPFRVTRMRQIWNIYYDRLSNHPKIYMIKPNDNGWIPWFIDILINDPDELKFHLKDKNIGSRRIYPPIHQQIIYQQYNHLSFPITEHYSNQGLWLPSSSQLTDLQIHHVCDSILSFFSDL